MLISFSVENFRSIGSRQELNLLALPSTGREKELDNYFEDPKYGYQILKSAVIYGANASGKSNLMLAMDRMALFVLRSIDFKVHHKLWHEPFILTKLYATQPTEFTATFIADDRVLYEYSFAYEADGITSEELYSWPNNRKTLLFERRKSEIRFGSSFTGDKKVLQETLLHNHLLLTKAANTNFDVVMPAYNFFAYKFKIHLDTRNLMETENSAMSTPEVKQRVLALMQAADIGILDFDIQAQLANEIFDKSSQLNEFQSGYTKPLRLDTHTVHKSDHGNVRWPMENESLGTQRLFKIAGPVINALKDGLIFAMDELNNSLHPEICKFIVETFHSNTSEYPAQLIFTTHDTSIMTSELFRRDQIWFTEKNKTEETELFSLASFAKDKVRHNTPFDKWYLSGRFGAVPIVTSFEHVQTDGSQE